MGYQFPVHFTDSYELGEALKTGENIYVGCASEGYDGNDLIRIEPSDRGLLDVYAGGGVKPDYRIRASRTGAERVNRDWEQYYRECVAP